MNHLIDKTSFNQILDYLNAPKLVDREFLYDVYNGSIEVIDSLISNDMISGIKEINQLELINYCIGEYVYTFSNVSEEQKNKLYELEKQTSHMSGVIADKFVTLCYFSHDEKRLTNKYLPSISSLSLYLNFIISILENYQKNDPVSTLISDLLNKSISIARCVLDQLVAGYETEAFALWRTLHECECTLLILDKYGDPLIHSYLHHMNFALTYNGAIKEQEAVDQVFQTIKSEMKQHDLKSKDMKKFIEYGWLYAVNNIEPQEIKLNFRDGLQKIAGMEKYNKVYLMSSEIIHSTPLLIYSDKQYFFYTTLINLYESFFRLEKVFVNLFVNRVSKEQLETYQNMRNVYYSQLIAIHQRESKNYISLIKAKN